MKKFFVISIILAIVGTGIWYVAVNRQQSGDNLRLYGNMDIRQISLAFEYGGRLTEMTAEEGNEVSKGQLLARVDTQELTIEKQRLLAEISGREQALLKLENGNRPEEIAQAKAQVESAKASLAQADKTHRRMQELLSSHAVSKQDADNAQATWEVAKAQLTEAEKGYRLMVIGPRSEDIESARAALEAARAELAALEYRLKQAELKSPANAVVRSRLLEPGSMVSAQTPVYLLSLLSPKWARVYVTEPQLGHIRPGMKARVICDSYPDAPISGHVGYISSSAEFTPKNVQTEDLRTALLYEVRIIVDDPGNILRLGMPVTVIMDTPEQKADI